MFTTQERRNYDDIILRMGLEIDDIRKRNVELQTLTASSDSELLKRCTQLVNKVMLKCIHSEFHLTMES